MNECWILSNAFSASIDTLFFFFSLLIWLLLFSCWVMSNSLGLMDCSMPVFCPQLSPGVYSNSCPFESAMLSNHLILCWLLLLLPSIFPSIRVFFSELALPIRWPEYWRFSFSINPSNEYSGFISFRIDWFDLFAARDSQQSSPAPQFESVNSLVLSLMVSHIHTWLLEKP